MANQKIDRLEQLIKTYMDGVVTPEDLKEAIDALIALVNKSEARIAKVLEARDGATSAETSRLVTQLTRQRAEMERLIETARTESGSSIEKKASELSTKIAALQSSLPTVSERIDSIERMVAQVPEEHTGEDVRNMLEALPEGDKLVIEAIEGLRKELDDLKTQASKSGGGGGLDVTHWPRHESFTMNGSDTSVDLSAAPAAAGHAIFGVEYQGQTLVRNSDYTVDGIRITFVSLVPENGTVISVSYMP